ncbi:hypothetical protein KI387_013963, partial [Taxus chinensis]
SLEHSVHLVCDGDGAILHQGLLYLVFFVVSPDIELVCFPPSMGQCRRSPSPSPHPSPISLHSSSHCHCLHISFDSDSDVTILNSSHDAATPSAPPVPPHPHIQSCLLLEDAATKVPSLVSSPNVSHAEDTLGLAQLYPDSLDSMQMETTKTFVDTTIHNVGDDLDLANSSPQTNSPLSPPNQDLNPIEPVVADSVRDECRVELVSSILSKL